MHAQLHAFASVVWFQVDIGSLCSCSLSLEWLASVIMLPFQAAKDNRLRRLCEVKPSGKINVPQEVHDRWAKGGDVRKALLAELEAADWNKVGSGPGLAFTCDFLA